MDDFILWSHTADVIYIILFALALYLMFETPIILGRKRKMSKGRLAKALGFLGVESLEQNSFEIAHDDSKTWYITILPEGDYALWNNKETDPNLVMYFDTPDEVIEYLHRWKKENDPMDHLIIESMYKK